MMGPAMTPTPPPDAPAPDELPRSSRPVWQLVAQEVAAYTAAGLLMPLGLTQDRRRTPRAREQRTVVLVHGYLANRSSLAPLALYLRLHGWRQVLQFNYDSRLGVDSAARALREFLRRRVRGGRIDLVCHSMGGLVARAYIQDLGGQRRVDNCVTICTPHQGTYSAYWLPSRAGRQMHPDSPLMRRLAEGAGRAGGVRFLSIAAQADQLVLPRIFSGHGEQLIVPHVGHLGVLFSPRVFRAVRDRLRLPALDGLG